MFFRKALPYLILPIFLLSVLIITLIVDRIYAGNIVSLYLTPYTPNNELSSAFVFDGWANYALFFYMTAVSTVCIMFLPAEQKYLRALFLAVGTIYIGLYAEMYVFNNIYMQHIGYYGQSGLTMALTGLVVGTILIDITYSALSHNIGISVVLLAIIASIFSQYMYNSNAFFLVGVEHIAWQVHETAFYTGVIVGMFFAILQYISIYMMNRQYGFQEFLA